MDEGPLPGDHAEQPVIDSIDPSASDSRAGSPDAGEAVVSEAVAADSPDGSGPGLAVDPGQAGFWKAAADSTASGTGESAFPGEALWNREPAQPDPVSFPVRRFDLERFFVLLAFSFVATLAVLPFMWHFLRQVKTQNLPEEALPFFLIVTATSELLISAATIAAGLACGPSVNLGMAFVSARTDVEPEPLRRIWRFFIEPLALGIAAGACFMFLNLGTENSPGPEDQPLSLPPVWVGLLASIGAGVREEIWLRLGLMTLFVWLGVKLTGRRPTTSQEPPASIVGLANLLAALAFAAMHVPQALVFLGLSGPVLVFVFLGNGLPGLLFGWLYWRRGLIPAMLAHTGLDLVLKIFIPLVS